MAQLPGGSITRSRMRIGSINWPWVRIGAHPCVRALREGDFWKHPWYPAPWKLLVVGKSSPRSCGEHMG